MNLVKSCDLIRILYAILYFTDKHFASLFKLFCKIANPQDIDLKFSGSISDIDIDSPTKCREGSMLRICISKNSVFPKFPLQFTDQTGYFTFSSDSVPPKCV